MADLSGISGKASHFPLLGNDDKPATSGGGYVASAKNDAIDFNAKERYVDLSGVSAFCQKTA